MRVQPASEFLFRPAQAAWKPPAQEASATTKAASETAGALPTFYINRDKDTARKDSIEAYARAAGISAERIGGVEGLAVPAEFRDYFFTGETLHSLLKPGEVGCYASHLSAMQVIVERGVDYALVLEDDAVLPINLRETLADVIANLPRGWDLVQICYDTNRAVKPIAQLKDGRRVVRYSRIPENATGYLISRAGAQKFLQRRKRYWPLDTDFRQPWRFQMEVYGVAPRILSASTSFESSIHLMGNHSRLRRGLPIPKSYCWTGNPLHTGESLLFNIRKLGPITWSICTMHNVLRRVVTMLGLRPVMRRLRLEALGRRVAVSLAVR